MKARKGTKTKNLGRPTPQKKPRPAKLRIIGGQMRGRTVHYHGADFTRPMKDNVRENLFNILGPAIRGTLCFDLFSGTGALAFESISRGAQSVVAIEQSRPACKAIQKTANELGVDNQVRVLAGDALRLSSEILTLPEDDTPWIVFLCPPYVLWTDSLEQMSGIIRRFLQHAPLGSVLVAETDRPFDMSLLPKGDWDIREYGNVRLAFIQPAMRCGLEC